MNTNLWSKANTNVLFVIKSLQHCYAYIGTCSRDYECEAHQACNAGICTCLPGFKNFDDECFGKSTFRFLYEIVAFTTITNIEPFAYHTLDMANGVTLQCQLKCFFFINRSCMYKVKDKTISWILEP